MDLVGIGASAFGGLAGAAALLPVALGTAPRSLVRTNVAGRTVGATLGLPVVGGATVGVVLGAATWWATGSGDAARILVAVELVVLVMAAAGLWDDLQGDERPRGFGGHIGAIRGGALTGGIVKMAAGAGAGIGAGLLVAPNTLTAIEIGVLAAGVANLMNLLDRAPGRASKVGLVAGAGLLVAAPVAWSVAAGGIIAALGVTLVPDLRERAMLGDAGVNPVGAALGLGLALAVDRPGRLLAIVVVLGLNLASERWSFSTAIARTRPLAALDRWGRRRDVAEDAFRDRK